MQVKINPYPGNPLKESGKIARCNFRSIVYVDNVYHIFEEDHIYGAWRIFKRLSENGIDLGFRIGPLIRLGRQDEFDAIGTADPTVIYDGQWKMWYDAFDITLHWDKIGYATSDDGENWTKYGSVLSRGVEGEWDSKSIHHPVVLKHDRYYLYYSGCCDDIYNVKSIGLAISDDGITWNKIPGPVIINGQDGEWDCKYVRPSLPVFVSDRWLMFYWGFNGVHHSMGLAISDDLIHWQKAGKLMSGTNSSDGITAVQPLMMDNLKLWYAVWDSVQIHVADVEYK